MVHIYGTMVDGLYLYSAFLDFASPHSALVSIPPFSHTFAICLSDNKFICMHTMVEELLGANWGPVFCLKTLRHVDYRGWGPL